MAAPLRASFNADGSVKLPRGYREWYHMGTRYKPDGISILVGKPITAHEVLNAYIEPGALASFRTTGRWPDGTQMVKEFSVILTGKGCDPTTNLCVNKYGKGIFEAHYIGLGLMVKDGRRFPDRAGNWGYFQFGHRPPPYASADTVRPPDQCQSCHVRLASDTEYVIAGAHVGIADMASGN